ncbi:MAG: DUF262 domain-containing protein [Marinifilaceae bacterium]|jgi:uncharacterized protein with ParB-like and HNH nuclease domain
MHKQIQVKPQVDRLLNLLTLIEDGKFKIPTFQRDFVWDDKAKIDLFDSISKEYPIGSILLWRPKETYSNKFDIGPYSIDSFNNSDFYYILDGFQRMSTLFGCLTNPYKTDLSCDESARLKKFNMVYNLEDEAFLMNRQNDCDYKCIPVYKLIDTYEFLDFIDQLRTNLKNDENINLYIERARELSSTIIDYQVPSIEIHGGGIADAVDIFSRVNSKGIDISPDWMLSALTSNEKENFNLGDIFTDLLNELDVYNFSSLKRSILVQCIQNSFGKAYFDQKIEELAERSDFIPTTLKTVESIKVAIKFLFEELLVINKKLLPYNGQLIFLSYFFYNVKSPSSKQIDELKRWFWITSYSNYFTIYSLSKIREAYKQFDMFVRDENIDPVYYHNKSQSFITADLPITVSSGSVRSKAFQLFLLNDSYDCRTVNLDDVDSYKITYLSKSIRTHASFVPEIRWSKNSNNVSECSKNKEYDYIDFNDRLKQIEIKEREFVESLGISYQDIS